MSKISQTGTGTADGRGGVLAAGLLTRMPEENLAFMLIAYHNVHDMAKNFYIVITGLLKSSGTVMWHEGMIQMEQPAHAPVFRLGVECFGCGFAVPEPSLSSPSARRMAGVCLSPPSLPKQSRAGRQSRPGCNPAWHIKTAF